MILFVCSQANLRSRTAELLCLFGGLDARCCGTEPGAFYPANDDLLRMADLVVCMEIDHQIAIKDFQHYDKSKVVTLRIPDDYDRLSEMLIKRLIYEMSVHSEEVAIAMKKGVEVLNWFPEYKTSLGTNSNSY